jgi:homoserine kinase type II
MSVYTEVGRDDLIAFLGEYAVGDLVSYQGISDGIENTNYFVTTTEGEFVLTLFEQHDFGELAYFLQVMTFFLRAWDSLSPSGSGS